LRRVTVLELRQYTLHPGRRDELITLFEREFVEAQEELGARVVGTFRDVTDPDRFVWIRAFDDMTSRHAALTGFYGGPVWMRHRDAANATMIHFDDVLLLEPVGDGFSATSRAAIGKERRGPSRVLAVVWAGGAAEPDTATVERLLGVTPVLARTAPYVNDYPALPVRDEQAVVWFASYTWPAGAAAARERLAAHPLGHEPGLEVLELEPTARSALR